MASASFMPEYGDGSATGSTLSIDHQENSMPNGRLGENVMPMELAIKREIAYRMKMEKLQSRPGASAGMPARTQALSSAPGPTLLGMKRKASSSNGQCSSMQQSWPSFSRRPFQNHPDSLYCKVCELACSSVQCLKQHKQGNRHKANLENFVESQKNRSDGANKQMWCKICRVPCSDERAYTQHLAGKKHAAVVSARSAQKRAEREVSKIKWDELEWETL